MEEKIKTKKKTEKKTPVAKKPVKSKEAKEKAVVKKETKVAKAEVKTTKKIDSNRFAVIKIGGGQLKVAEGGKYEIEKIEGNKGDKIETTDVLLIADGDKVTVGKPLVKGAKVKYTIDSQKKDKKIDGFKYKAKSRYRKQFGHRALITRILVDEIAAK